MRTTESWKLTGTKLKRIAWLSERDSNKELQCLMHLYNMESLEECFHMLDGKKAVGIDGITKQHYSKDLLANLGDLLARMKRMAYKPRPVREHMIEKEGKPGAKRPLGIGVFEDKIVQKMTQRILESIYEPNFRDCSHGFRPGKSCHSAIKNLMDHLFKHEVETVIDVDIANFFGTIDHDWLVKMLRYRIKDEKFIRYLIRMFKAGILSEGELKMTEEGVPQGSVCSPILANIFAHYVVDLWFEVKIKKECKGTVHMVRYADDMVICCNDKEDALYIREQLNERLAKFNLKLNEEKTKLVDFSRKKARAGIKQGTFDFLGFTIYWGRSEKGYVIPKLQTRGKTMRVKLKKMNDWAKKTRSAMPLKEIWKIFKTKLTGHFRYYGVSHNSDRLNEFHRAALSIMFKWLNRRSQRKSFTWEKFWKFVERELTPTPKIYLRLF